MNIINKIGGLIKEKPSAANDTVSVDQDKARAVKPAIGAAEIRKANETLRKYQEGKARLDARLVENEQFYKMRQWDAVNQRDKLNAQQKDVHSTAWLFSCIESRYADMMDSYPAPNVRPRQQDDVEEAQKLSSVLPIINEQIGMEHTYSQMSRYALKHGTFACSVLWDPSKHNGLGDISANRVDLLSLYWEPGVTDIQDSANVFHLSLVNNSILEAQYPQLKGKLGGKPIVKTEYRYDDSIKSEDKSVVVDWYYKTYQGGKTVLHYCKYVNDVVLYSTLNDTTIPTVTEVDAVSGLPVQRPLGKPKSETGLYDHGKYPYVIEALFPIEGSIAGYGYIDVGRDTQVQIDLLSKAVVENATMGASPRYFTSEGTKINENEFLDFTKKIIHVAGGTVTDEDLRPVDAIPLNGNYINVLTALIDQLKYTTANQDANNGVAPSGVTAGSAIAALQEVAGKNARASNKTAYRVFKNVTYMEIELIRQFYAAPRYFRVTPDDSRETFEMYDNSGLKPQTIPGTDLLRSPEFDIEVSAEKASPYRKMEINELALTFYKLGFFSPQNADQASSCLSMMDFNGKKDILQKVQANGTIYQKLLQYQQLALMYALQVDSAAADTIAQDIMTGSGGAIASLPKTSGGGAADIVSGLSDVGKDEHASTKKARAQARQTTSAE